MYSFFHFTITTLKYMPCELRRDEAHYSSVLKRFSLFVYNGYLELFSFKERAISFVHS